MAKLNDHPTVIKYRKHVSSQHTHKSDEILDHNQLKDLCLKAGADDVGFVNIDIPELDKDREHIMEAFSPTRSLISIVCRMNREPVRSPARSVANTEFHSTGHKINDVCRDIVTELENRGIRAVNPAMAFPMEMSRWGSGKIWTVSHKVVAVAAGLGMMGIHRNVIHPKFGNYILLGTILLENRVAKYSSPIDYNPCLKCKLCVAACPTGAIHPDGYFDFSACYTHNYREFMSGFQDWIENLAESKDAREYRARVSDPETVSMWQSITYGANYKAANCIAVCPAGEDVIGPFLENRAHYLDEVVRPFQDKTETVYVIPNSDPELYVKKRFQHKKTKRVSNALRPHTIDDFITGLRLIFQRERSKDLNAVYHFTFTGETEKKYTITIKDKTLGIEPDHIGKADSVIHADAERWLSFIRKEAGILGALLSRKIRVKGPIKLLKSFGECFPP